MKYTLTILLLSLFLNSLSAQDVVHAVINATGKTYTQSNGEIFEWSVGEMALIESMIDNKAVVTNGLLQPVVTSQILTTGFALNAMNILSPNGDGKNDLWVVEELEKYPDNDVTIFDRAGRKVFFTRNYKSDWNGYINGIRLTEDTYYYVIKLRKNGSTGTIKGFITIIN